MQTSVDPFELATRAPHPPRNDVMTSLVDIDVQLEEDAIVEELGPEPREPGARLRVWCSE